MQSNRSEYEFSTSRGEFSAEYARNAHQYVDAGGLQIGFSTWFSTACGKVGGLIRQVIHNVYRHVVRLLLFSIVR